MALTFHPVHPLFGAECRDLDLRLPIGREMAVEIEAAMDRYGVLVFRGQPLSSEQHTAFAVHFGPVEPSIHTVNKDTPRRLGAANIADISNLAVDNTLLARDDRRRLFSLGNQLWHSDSSFKAPAAKYSLLNAHVVPPEGGDTEFVDTRVAWDRLPEGYRRRIQDLVCEHSLIYSRALLGFDAFNEQERRDAAPVRHPLVRRHPGSQRRSVFLSSHIGRVLGLPVPEGMALIRDLMERATERELVYQHRWSVGDLVVWDNRCTMHRGRANFGLEREYPRDLRRVTLEDAEPRLAVAV